MSLDSYINMNVGSGTTSTVGAIASVKGVMTSLGIASDTFCDPTGIVTSIEKLIAKYEQEVVDTFDSISVRAGGNFIITALTLLGAILGSTVLAWADTFINEFVFGNLLGTYYGLISLFLSAMPAAEIYLQYLAAVSLRLQLQRRITLAKLVNNNVSTVIDLLRTYKAIFSFSDQINYNDLSKAASYVQAAERMVGIEASKMLTSTEQNMHSLSRSNLTTAQTYIDDAISTLINFDYGIVKTALNQILLQHKIKRGAPSTSASIGEWIQFFKDIHTDIYNEYFTYTSPTDQAQKYALYQAFIQSLLKYLPGVLQVLILQQSFNAATSDIISKFPVTVGLGETAGALKKAFDDVLSGGANSLLSALNMSTTPPPTNSFYVDPDTKDLTLQTLSTNIKIYETLILMFPTMWKNILTMGQLYLGILEQVVTNLQGINEEITDAVTNKMGKSDLAISKLNWSSQLTYNKGLLTSIIGYNVGVTTSLSASQSIAPIDIATLITDAGIALDTIKEFILYKSVDPVTGATRQEPMDIALPLAQTLLLPLMSNIAILLAPAKMDELIAKLQSIRILLNIQVTLDTAELKYINNFINIIEGSSVFQQLQQLYNDLFGKLGNSPGKKLALELANGDISTLASFYEAGQSVSDLVKLVTCSSNNTNPFYIDALIGNLSVGSIAAPVEQEIKRIQKEITTAVNTLKDKKNFLKVGVDQCTDIINTIENKLVEPATTVLTTVSGNENTSVSAIATEIDNIYLQQDLAY